MFQRTAVILVLVAGVFLLPSCRRLDAPDWRRFPGESLQGSTSIPANWGNLVSANVSPRYPNIVLLWFQDDGGNVRMVGYDVGTSVLINVTQIRRQ